MLVSSIDDFVVSIDILIDHKVNHGASNVLFIASSASWNLVVLLWNVALLALTATSSSYLAREYARGNRIYANLEMVLSNKIGKCATQVDCSSFAGIVSRMMLRVLEKARDGSNVDDSSRIILVLFRQLSQ